jgi:serine-type D-Ala-D-Ala carboxypeptidase/endopeptidase (penicillin-binding protein 4)
MEFGLLYSAPSAYSAAGGPAFSAILLSLITTIIQNSFDNYGRLSSSSYLQKKSFMSRLIAFFLLVFIYSCSTSGRITKTAKTNVLQAAALKNAHVGISIFDPQENKTLYNYQQEKYFVPASNTKILTFYTALKYLPDSLLSYYYQVNGDTISIQPAGDPTFLHEDFKLQPAFENLKRYKIVRVEDAGFTQHLGSGWSWNDYQENYMVQRSLLPLYGNLAKLQWKDSLHINILPPAFQQLVKIKGNPAKGFSVEKPWEENIFYIGPGVSRSSAIPFRPHFETIISLLTDTLGISVSGMSVNKKFTSFQYSQPKDSMLKPMMHRSDNFFAEQCLVMVAKQLMNSNYVNSVIDSMMHSEFKDLPQKLRWVDGSGLSRYNLFTPASLVAVLDKMQSQFGMNRLKIIMASGGEGTLNNYYVKYGERFFAKTGTLSGVVALSGYMYTKKNRFLIFSVLVNNHLSSATDVRRAVEKFLTEVMEEN